MIRKRTLNTSTWILLICKGMIEVRNYTADDYEDFCRLNIAWIGEHWQLEPRDYEEMEQMRQGVEPGFMLVAVEAGQVVGTIAFLPMDGTVYDYELAKFAVDRNCRGKGIGRLLLQAALNRAASEGKQRIYIITNKLCFSAIHLYEAFGFVQIPGVSEQFVRGDYLMAKGG